MAVKVITDSCSDLTQDEAKQLGITVVPAYVRFGNEVYRDGIDIDSDEFYNKLVTSPIHPSTASPSPGDFAKVYEAAMQETNEIVSIHVSMKHSTVLNAALVGRDIVARKGYQIEVIDSQGVTMWQGLIAIAAAKAAMTGYNLQPIVNKTHKYIKQLRGLGMLDTLSYAVKGGRLGKTISAIESLLNVKPLVTVKHGQVCLAGLARTRNKAIARLQLFLKTITHIDDLAIVHSTNMEEPLALADYACRLFPNISPRIARLGPAVGTHAGPRALVVVLKTNFQTEPCSNPKKSGA